MMADGTALPLPAHHLAVLVFADFKSDDGKLEKLKETVGYIESDNVACTVISKRRSYFSHDPYGVVDLFDALMKQAMH